MPKLEKRGRYYSFRYYSGSQLLRESTKETDYMKAKIYMQDFIAEKNKSVHKTFGKYNIDCLLWSDFCDKFMEYCRYNKTAPESDARVIRAINKILRPKLFKDLNAETIRKYIVYRKDVEKLKDNSVNRDLHVIKSMWKFAVTELFGDNVKNQASLVKEIPTNKITKTKFFTSEEIKRIVAHPTEEIQTALYLMLYLGLRLKEAICLRWDEIDFDKMQVKIFPHKTKRTNPNPAFVPLNNKLAEFLQSKHCKQGFVVGKDKDLSPKRCRSNISHIIANWLKKLKISGTAHTCRHTFISHLIMAGIDGTVVMRWARINKPEILQVYLHLSPRYTNDMINALPY